MTESAWIAHGVTNEDFEKYENEVERFVATLQTMIAKLHDEGHLDNAALAQFGMALKEKPSPQICRSVAPEDAAYNAIM